MNKPNIKSNLAGKAGPVKYFFGMGDNRFFEQSSVVAQAVPAATTRVTPLEAVANVVLPLREGRYNLRDLQAMYHRELRKSVQNIVDYYMHTRR